MSQAYRELPEVEEDIKRLEEFFEVLLPDLDNFVPNHALSVAREVEKVSTGPSPKRARLLDGEEDEDVIWEDDEGSSAAAGAALVTACAPAVNELAINPLVLELDQEGSSGTTKNMDQNILELMREHAVYLAKHRVPKLQQWQDTLVTANIKTSNTMAATEEEATESHGVNALLRRVALLNIRLKRSCGIGARSSSRT